MASHSKSTQKKRAKKSPPAANRWSQRVTQTSDALDLKPGVFTLRDPKEIALSLISLGTKNEGGSGVPEHDI